jgi:DNA-binding CsgD family transcriptional regulator
MVVRLAVDCATLAASGEPYDGLLVTGLHRIIGSDNGALINHIDTSQPVGGRILSTSTDGRSTATGVMPYAEDALLDEIGRGSHPVVGAMEAGNKFATVRVSDMISMPKLWASEFYRVTSGPSNARYSVAVQLQMRGNLKACTFLNRTNHDFTTSEMELLELLRVPLASAIAFRADLDDATASLNLAWTKGQAPNHTNPEAITPRQREVLALLALGWTNAKIGHRLGITERTVRKHVADICEHLHVKNRAAAAASWERLRFRYAGLRAG